ncbi:MAG: hypothetical protein PHW79_06385 [Candidatus Marinimicrobia bacterium]|nr:hypothetical protein [Candidatus Neomarinimicrobiota bacterium]
MKTNRFKYHHFFLLVSLLVACVQFSNCSRKIEDVPVAKVAGRVITAGEFAFAYEMSPRSLTGQKNDKARQAVLNQLIDTIVLARQAERQKLDDDPILLKSVDFYTRLAINRELYLKHVRKLVTVAESEERTAFERRKTTLFVQHFVSEQADIAREVSFGTRHFKHTPLFPGAQQVNVPGSGIADKVKWSDVPADVTDLLYNLPIKQNSVPFFDGRLYHVFQIVEKEREVLLRENDYQVNRESIHGVLRMRKEQKVAATYIQQIMEPQNVIIKAAALNALTAHIWKNRPTKNETLTQYISNEEINSISSDQHKFLNDDIAVFKSGQMSVADVLLNYKVNPVKISYQSERHLRESLTNAVGMYARDWVLSEQGKKERLDRRPSVIEEKVIRKENLLARKMISQLGRQFYSQNPDTADTSPAIGKYIADYTTQLKKKENIKIFTENLMAVKTTDIGLARKIDFVAFHTQ